MAESRPLGFWSKTAAVPYAHLVPGQRYRVTRAFADFDGVLHDVGETWTYLGTAYLPYDDGRSLFVSIDDTSELHIRMQDRAEEQAEVLAKLELYLAPASTS